MYPEWPKSTICDNKGFFYTTFLIEFLPKYCKSLVFIIIYWVLPSYIPLENTMLLVVSLFLFPSYNL